MLRNKLNEFWNLITISFSPKKKKTSINTFQPVCVKVEYPEIVCQRLRPILSSMVVSVKRRMEKKKKRRKKNHVDRLTCPQVCAHAENRYAKGNWKRHARGPLVVSLSFFFSRSKKERRRDILLPRPSFRPFYFFRLAKGSIFARSLNT